jgi:hypothetical protein
VDNDPRIPTPPTVDPAEEARRKAEAEQRRKEEEERRKAEEARRQREELEQKWQDDWLSLRLKLDFDRWDPKNSAVGPTANGVLARMKAEATRKDQSDASERLDEYARAVVGEASRLDRADREKASRIVAWCDMFATALKGVDDLKGHADMAGRARTEAIKVAQFKGTVTIRLAPAPFAEVLKVTREGAPVALPSRFTPVTLQGVEIGAFEIELSHPAHGKKTLKLDAAKLKDAKTYTVSGSMKGAAFEIEEK